MTAAGEGLSAGRIHAQIGVESDAGTEGPLRYPTMARWTERGTCVIVDRCQPANRVLEVEESGAVLWEIHRPPRMNTATPVGRDLLAVTVNGALYRIGRDGAPAMVTGVPDTVFECADARDGILALGSDAGIDLIGADGRALRRIRPSAGRFTNPTGVELLPGGALLVADAWDSRVLELGPRGERTRSFGHRRSQGQGPGFLTGPRSACRTHDGATIVADTLAHRLVEFEPDGARAHVIETTGHAELFAPNYVRECPDGTLVVADTGNRRVLRMTRTGALVWEYGPGHRARRLFSFPRSAEQTDSGSILVCDALNHRVLEVRGANEVVRELGEGLVIPRSATRARNGHTVIADGVNGRVLVLDRHGRMLREITSVVHRGARVALKDPHLARFYDEALLIVDSDAQAVWLLDERGRTKAAWGYDDGLRLSDPHYAAITATGAAAITDSGNHRIVITPPPAADSPRPRAHAAAPAPELRYPRFARPYAGGLLIADTDHSRVIHLGPDAVRTTAGPVAEADDPISIPEIRTPRWVSPLPGGRLLVTDYANSRILLVTLTAPRGDEPPPASAQEARRPEDVLGAAR